MGTSSSLCFKHELLSCLLLLDSLQCPRQRTRVQQHQPCPAGSSQQQEPGQNPINLLQSAQSKKTAEILSPIWIRGKETAREKTTRQFFFSEFVLIKSPESCSSLQTKHLSEGTSQQQQADLA